MASFIQVMIVKFVAGLLMLFIVTVSSQSCRSYQRQTGRCVSIKSCPPLLHVLTHNPNAAQLRSLQRLTCGFDSLDPKVCCPLVSIVEPDSQSANGETTVELKTNFEPKMKVSSTPIPPIFDEDSAEYASHPAFKQLPLLQDCGTGVGEERIIGGQNVSHGNFPWMARIGYKIAKRGNAIEFHCGGTVISKRFILTAAHCSVAVEDEHKPVSIRLGEHDTLTEEDCNAYIKECSKVEDYNIEEIITHSEYNINSKQHDITLIRVDRDINFTTFISPICLPYTKEYHFELDTDKLETGIVAGFGRTKWNHANGSTILQQVRLPLKTNEECQKIYNRRVKITPNQLCAGGEQGQDSCGGDSGGPLMAAVRINNISKLFQLGVVSFGPTHCGVGGLPGVYVRIQNYLSWILDTIEKHSSSS